MTPPAPERGQGGTVMPLSVRPPFRADHVGSLLRAPTLKALRLEKESGRASEGDLRAAEDAAIREVVALQEAAGLQGITDGELRRKSWRSEERRVGKRVGRGGEEGGWRKSWY